MRYFLIFSIFLFFINCEENYDTPNHVPSVVKVVDDKVYVAYGEGGLIISDAATQNIIGQIFPPQEMHSIDDFDVDGDLIFVLDTRGRDFMAVFSIERREIELVTSPVQVQGGPFNGISASNGNLVVSGGTFFLERFRYSRDGKIEGPVSFGRDRGHPDMSLSSDGSIAFLSTDFSLEANPRFGVLSLFIGNKLEIPTVLSELGIKDAGFSDGVTTPIGFPIKSAEHNDHLIVAHGSGLTIIPLTEGVFGTPENIDIGIKATAISIASNIAYVVGLNQGNPMIVRVDLTDVTNPIIEPSEILNSNELPTSVAASESDVYIALGRDGILQIPFAE